ncbi:MAG: hypothetical protein DI564_11845 [Rhodanobacter denitrificans]|uniref:YCII-related domain-containing protein n=1 Tax=Rhodanobacter denitrificans TaxID=666685 RepID=A0A2W5M727_9GAMM|nr:MAG: hypothetical protein DI564_11845 [Rhodanobacter denitrificans]
MSTYGKGFAMAIVFLALGSPAAADPPPVPATPIHDAALARALGADELGMRHYVLVVLKTGPHTMPAGPERDAMFKGHFANISRLAADGKLAVAGSLDGVDGWRGLFILATADLDEARRLVETDPVVARGEMVAEYHALYSSAALMQVNETHGRIAAKQRP